MANSKEVAKLDRIFSHFIRMRDANKNGVCRCISCGNPFFWKDGDCGHYVNRKHMSLRFSEVNCNAQCRACNRFDEGNPAGYTIGLKKKYKPDIIEQLLVAKQSTSHMSDYDLKILGEYYKRKIKEFEKEKSL